MSDTWSLQQHRNCTHIWEKIPLFVKDKQVILIKQTNKQTNKLPFWVKVLLLLWLHCMLLQFSPTDPFQSIMLLSIQDIIFAALYLAIYLIPISLKYMHLIIYVYIYSFNGIIHITWLLKTISRTFTYQCTLASKVWNEMTYPFPYFNGVTVEIWKWIRVFIQHFLMDLITYPWWDLRYSLLVEGPWLYVISKTVCFCWQKSCN